MNFLRFFSQSFGAVFYGGHQPIVRTYQLRSSQLGRKMKVEVYRPSIFPNRRCRLLICLDGQDLKRMAMRKILEAHLQAHPRRPVLVVGLHAGDRIREYGTADRPDYQARGDLSRAHQAFILEQLLPWLERRYELWPAAKYRAVLGFSLGGLHAFDLAWHHSQQLGSVGVFSGALWWRSKEYDEHLPDANRIVHDYVAGAPQAPPGLRVWLMAGTEDEKEDRNKNGVIDAIDDTVDLQNQLAEKGLNTDHQLSYHEEINGRHEPVTWGKVMPIFLRWWYRRS